MPQAATVEKTEATITKIVKKANGQIEISFSTGETMFFGGVEDIQNYFMPLQNSETAKMLLLAWWSARSSDLSNTNLVIDKTLTFDLSAASPIKVQ